MKKNSKNNSGMSLIVKTVTRWTILLIILYGLYITFFGHLGPGGGFAGGVIVVLSFIHIILAYGKDFVVRRINEYLASILETTGGLMFLSIAILGFATGIFFKDFLGQGKIFSLFSGGIILPANVAIMLKVGFGMLSAFLCLILFSLHKGE
ncbi:MAG: MnhB domain-containing protein [Endomicrobiia bacterium]